MTKQYDDSFIRELKNAILQSRYQAARLVNKKLIVLYFDIGKKISSNIKKMAWGSKVIDQISFELQKELPGLKGFSSGNIKKMRVFSEFWLNHLSIGSTVSNQLINPDEAINLTLPNLLQKEGQQLISENFANVFFSVSFSNHYLIASKTNSLYEAWFYLCKTASEFWSYRHLEQQLKTGLYSQQGKLPNNFKSALSPTNNEKALKSFKDEYLLDFINIENPDEEDERLIENEIVRNIKKFILTIGNDFAFMGNQYRLIVEEQEYFIDLLFFNRKIQCLVAFELKTGKFKPEYLGKMNFYLSALDDTIRQPHENPSIGIILCKEKNNKIVEYSFRDFSKAMGVATYRTSSEIPEQFKDALPNAESLKNLLK
ncbi:PDDEXK nuclease domain-containing protein [Olivibacter sitiensis]|uniref:PDDEXK nuclease domain-containing protein n=1 Tax=Olivibacter sitiensis TaxID=376470 RepID=UPI001B7F9E64|nr:PDDEXK nuclease domain-containing protein [Olivibacter sitiensis]